MSSRDPNINSTNALSVVAERAQSLLLCPVSNSPTDHEEESKHAGMRIDLPSPGCLPAQPIMGTIVPEP